MNEASGLATGGPWLAGRVVFAVRKRSQLGRPGSAPSDVPGEAWGSERPFLCDCRSPVQTRMSELILILSATGRGPGAG